MNTEITFSTTAKKSETEMTANVLEKNKQEQTLSWPLFKTDSITLLPSYSHMALKVASDHPTGVDS